MDMLMDWMQVEIEPTSSPLGIFVFRCTYCNHVVPKALVPTELGLREDEQPVPAHIYPCDACPCGYGRFVIAEPRNDTALPTDSRSSATADARATLPELREKIEHADHRKLAVREIRPNPHQPRKFFDQEALQSLADSIVQVGLLEDILVRPVSDGYELVLGERRWRATQLAGLDTVSAKVVPLTDEEVQRVTVVENVQRSDLTEVEEAFAYKALIDTGMRQGDVGSSMGKLGERVAERLKVLSSQYYVDYQEEQIRQLSAQIDRLRERLEERNARYEVRIVERAGLAEHLADGFDLVTPLEGGQFVVRRQL
ncbi:MAG: ParB/RepB/Spo0J family partition protein [Chloroflexi bacterium]|nr:ParB/RepB/Spo0J family partition protein [Chloroflexota bacterium]